MKVGLVLLLLVVLVVASLPWLARPLIAGALSAAFGRPVSIAALHWNTAELSVVADDVRIGTPPEQVTVRRITVAADPRGMDRRHVTIDRIGVEQPSGTVALDELLASGARAGASRDGPPTPPLAVTVREIVISDGTINVHPPKAAGADVALVITSARATGVELGGAAALQLSGDFDGTLDGAPLAGKADVQFAGEARRVVGELSVKKFAVRAGVLPLPPPFALLTGTLDATAKVAIGEPPGREAVDLDVRLAALRVDGQPGAALRAAVVALPGARVDLAERRVDLGPVNVQEPVLSLDLAASAPPPAATESGEPGWSLRSGAVSVRGGELRLRRGAAATSLRLERVRWDGLRDGAAPLSLTATAAGGGTLAVDGTVRVDPVTAELDVRVDQLTAAPWGQLVDLPVQLGRGTVSGSAKVVYRDGLRSIAGDLRASDVHTLPPDPTRSIEVMAVASAAAAFSYTPGTPATIDVSSATLSYPYAMVVRSDAGTFPYALLGDGSGGEGGTQATLHVGRLDVVDGKLEFVDQTLQPPFWTSLTGVAATAEQIALPPGTVDRFTLTGKRDELSPVAVSGALTAQGLGGRVEVTDVLLDSLNPYIAPRLGYRITSGRLSTVATATPQPPLLVSAADLVLNGVDVLQTGTDVILEQSGVPLPIALSLIADAGGEIDLSLPFSINTTSGDVAIGSVVWQAVRKAIVSALTSPLRILGSLFGTGGAPHAFAVEPIPFAAGSAVLDVAGRERVGQIARIVQAHTGLLLVLLPQITDADLAAVGADGAETLARDRNAAARDAFVAGAPGPALAAKRLLLAPWDPSKAAKATERPGVYVELQDAG